MFLQNQKLDVTQALEYASLYPEWEPNQKYTTDTILAYGQDSKDSPQLYRVLQDHASQADWTPDATSSLYKPIGFAGEIPIWSQPLVAEDAYHKGDIVSHGGKTWTSDVDNNVWEPGIYGWTCND